MTISENLNNFNLFQISTSNQINNNSNSNNSNHLIFKITNQQKDANDQKGFDHTFNDSRFRAEKN